MDYCPPFDSVPHQGLLWLQSKKASPDQSITASDSATGDAQTTIDKVFTA